MNATQTEIFLWVVLGIPAIIGIIYAIYYTIWFFYYNTTELIKEIRERRKRKNEKIPIKLSDLENNVGFIGEEDMTLQDKIEKLIKNGWSYGKLAKELGVSKTTISRWHKGECKPKLFEYYQRINSLYFALYEPKEILVNKPINTTKCKSWEEFEKEFFTDEFYGNAIAYHQKIIDELKKSREAQKWKFTEDEKVILRNLDKKYNWILREDNCLFIFEGCPTKYELAWDDLDSSGVELGGLNHLFKCIKENEGPCEFREFI